MFVEICVAVSFSQRAGSLAGERTAVSFVGMAELDMIKVLLGTYRKGDIVLGFEKYAFLPEGQRPKGFRQRYSVGDWEAAWASAKEWAKDHGVYLGLYKEDIALFPFYLAELLGCSAWELSSRIGRLLIGSDTCNMNDAKTLLKLFEDGELCEGLRDRSILESNVATIRGGLSFNKTQAQAIKCCGPTPAHLGSSSFPRRESPQGETREMRTWCSPELYHL